MDNLYYTLKVPLKPPKSHLQHQTVTRNVKFSGLNGDLTAMQVEKDGVGVGEEPRNNHNGERCAVVTNAQCSTERGAAY